MVKKFSRFEIAAIKRSLQNIAPLTKRAAVLDKKISTLTEERADIEAKIKAYYAALSPITCGVDPTVILNAEGYMIEIGEGGELPHDDNASTEVSVEVTTEVPESTI